MVAANHVSLGANAFSTHLRDTIARESANDGRLTVEEVKILSDVDGVLPAEAQGGIEASPFAQALGLASEAVKAADQLRLTPFSSGQSIPRALSSFLRTARGSEAPADAPRAALQAEAKLLAVVTVVAKLQQEIEQKGRLRIDERPSGFDVGRAR